MHISEINLVNESGIVRAEAQLIWEEADKAPTSLFFEVDAQFQDAFWADPNGFLMAAILPAWHAGEKRVKVDGALCPVLCNNLESSTRLLRSWYPELGSRPTIEPSQGFKTTLTFKAQAASFLSCDIDSLSILRWDRLHLPSDHPAAIRAAITICSTESSDRTEEKASERAQKQILVASQVAADAKCDSVSIQTNIRQLDSDKLFYRHKWHGAVLAATGYFLGRYFGRFYVPASAVVPHLGPWGSHPMLDFWYSSAHVEFEHHGLNMSRSEKIEIVADWPVGLQNILVCQNNEHDKAGNCGACEKCIGTMVGLEALGKLKGCQSFPVDEITPELLSTLKEYSMDYDIGYYRGLMPLLAERGRDDLVEAIEQLAGPHTGPPPKPTLTQQDVQELIPSGNTVIFAQEKGVRNVHGNFAGRRVLYWGPPSNDNIAIHELKSLRHAGGKFLVLREPVLWWLDHYSDFHQHLREQFTCIAENERFAIFDLQERNEAS
ncbi:hypothetical protein ACFL6S_16460 [Candidatus Poribacteria bacterium]